MKLPNLVEDPERTDSEDLTDEEIAGAVDTQNEDDWVQAIVSWAAEGYTVVSQEQRRRGEDLFIRTTLRRDEHEKVLVARTNWIGRTP